MIRVEVGVPCCSARDDETLARCEIVDVHDDDITVQFVDYGNTAIVEKAKIYKLPDHFMTTPKMAVQCTLKGAKQLELWPGEDVGLFPYYGSR